MKRPFLATGNEEYSSLPIEIVSSPIYLELSFVMFLTV
jgi:hypothetical protein